MSRFFRSGDSSTSSNTSEDDSEDEISSGEQFDDVLQRESPSKDAVAPPRAASTDHHRDLLLHALLEDRCLNEVRAEYSSRGQSRSESRIRAEANQRYQRLCDRLASYNLISHGLEHERHAEVRQRYRDGLDLLNSRSQSPAAVAPTLRGLINNSFGDDHRADIGITWSRAEAPNPLRRLLTAPEGPRSWPGVGLSELHIGDAPRSALDSRYRQEFEELGTLGRGGYGIVYQARHRLDNQIYAVKKVPLSARRLQKMQNDGGVELEEVLKEVRTLARLDHPNVVRYYNGWVELADGSSQARLDPSPRDDSDAVVSGADQLSGVMFEYSSESSAQQFGGPLNASEMHNQSSTLQRTHTRSTTATVSDETEETIDRTVDPSFSMRSDVSQLVFSEPTFVLHMQMSLHPMTLAEYLLVPVANGAKDASPCHCYHLRPSLSILTSVLDGLEYLHGQGIIHRDIKPANIFLSLNNNIMSPSSKRPPWCNDCTASDAGHLDVRIGDLGLVSVPDPATSTGFSTPIQAAAVGTEIYRPISIQATSPALDIYALGIVAFELLHPFTTRMERLHLISELKDGIFPDGFCKADRERRAEAIKKCILAMLQTEDQIADAGQIRVMIEDLQHAVRHV